MPKKTVILLTLLTLSSCEKATTIEQWECGGVAPEWNPFTIDLENKTATFGKQTRIVNAMINGNSVSFDSGLGPSFHIVKKDAKTAEITFTGSEYGVVHVCFRPDQA